MRYSKCKIQLGSERDVPKTKWRMPFWHTHCIDPYAHCTLQYQLQRQHINCRRVVFVSLAQSRGTVSHCPFIPHLHYKLSKTRQRHIFSHVPTLLTVSQIMSSEHCTASL